MGNALEIAGFDVAIVSRGIDVIRFVAREAPDILVCETVLCDTDAVQLSRRLRRQAASFPVIILADEPFDVELSSADRMTASMQGPSWIPAPCDEQRLVDLIRELISDLRSTTTGCIGFPTRVIWPTARRRAALLSR